MAAAGPAEALDRGGRSRDAPGDMNETNAPNETSEVLIVGGGLVGLTLAVVLASAGLRVAVVDRERPEHKAADPYDGRASAIALGSKKLLDGTGLWNGMAGAAAPILDIRVSDGDSLLFLHYDHKDVGDEPLGFIVENQVTRRALYDRVAAYPNLRLIAPATVARLERRAGVVEAHLNDGRLVRATLAVAADGGGSSIRKEAGIGTTGWSYGQTGIVCTISHEQPHRGIAHERFLPGGPFAVLPLCSAPGLPHRSSIVWTERPALSPAMMALSDKDFSGEIMRRFGIGLGRIAVQGRRWAYPLSLLLAETVTAHRLALVGDAAHVMHPIAGQGLNLGLRDVAALAEAIVDCRRLGLDIGGADALDRYRRWRSLDTLALLAVTDGLNRLFAQTAAPIRLIRDLGLAAVDAAPPLKRLFMRHAMGVIGDLPRLMAGQPL